MTNLSMKIQRDMLDRTYGVEIEMTGIARDKAANVARDVLGGTVRYAGPSYDRWAVTDPQGREWSFMSDASLHDLDYSGGCEMATPPLYLQDMDTLQKVIRALRGAGAQSYASNGCGVHVHIDGKNLGPTDIRNLSNTMACHEELLVTAIGIPESRMTYCARADRDFLEGMNKDFPQSLAEVSDLWYANYHYTPRTAHYNPSRYHMVHLHALFTKGTIEFRLFNFEEPGNGKKNGLHAGMVKAWVLFSLAMVCGSVYARNTTPSPCTTNRPRDTMRAWLRRYGFEGEDFKNAMYHMTRNLPTISLQQTQAASM